jgi:hypothetical protein
MRIAVLTYPSSLTLQGAISMTIYYLMVKTHKITGLKYLCQTSKQDPYNYCGSGIDWKKHLDEFGYQVNTEILTECHTKEELNTQGRYYSIFYKITTSVDNYGNRIWANRIPETGGGGPPTEATREKLRNGQLGKPKPPRNPEHTEKIASQARGKPNTKTATGLRKYFDSKPDRSSIIKKQSNSIKKWYQSDPDRARKKANKTWDSRVMSDYARLDSVNELIREGLTNTEIQSKIKIDYATIRKLRNRTHRFFSIVK